MNLQEFKAHMHATVNALLDDLEEGKDLDKYDLTISLNGQSIVLPLHADLYNNLESLIEKEIEEA